MSLDISLPNVGIISLLLNKPIKNIPLKDNFIMGIKNNLITLSEAANILGVSTATARNWVKHDYLKPVENSKILLFSFDAVNKLKINITNGTIDRLSSRANKGTAKKTFIPDEYLENNNNIRLLEDIILFIKTNNININRALFLLSLNLLYKKRILTKNKLPEILPLNNKIINNNQIFIDLSDWLMTINNLKITKENQHLLNFDIPDQRDILGLIYQSLLLEGDKSKNGSYYTPQKTVNDITNEYWDNNAKILDPCCGTGQFLLAFAETINKPQNLFGFDIDKIAVRIARINLLIKFSNFDFDPGIFHKNTMLDLDNYSLFYKDANDFMNFDIITTNPPWGLHFNKKETDHLKLLYPELTSLESFSYLLKKSIDLLKENGILSFILPESILNVKQHMDIRGYILSNTQIKKVQYLDRIFKNVFSPVIRLDLKKGAGNKHSNTLILKKDISYKVDQNNFFQNQYYIFNIDSNEKDNTILKKIYEFNHVTLKNNADWVLGIVTGNNKKYISNEKRDGYEEIFTGKDVKKYQLKPASNFIHFTPDKFQQVVPEYKYRVKEKLVYKFISKFLIFAYDNQKKLTLNSANSVIPKLKDYPLKVILALFNSILYQYIFYKKFNSIKVLRSHIEQLPLPLWDKKTFDDIIELVDRSIKSKKYNEEIDEFIMKNFSLNANESKYIKDIVSKI